MLSFIISKLKLYFQKYKWRKNNLHNFTYMANNFDPTLVTVGTASYGMLHVINYSDKYRLIIGRFCSIGPNVTFVVCGDHYSNCFSTYPFKVRYENVVSEAISKGDIIVGDDVWIGVNATILSGCRIGQGAIIMAGAVVTKDVPPYSVVGGVPARVIKMRFPPLIINKLCTFDYSCVTSDWITSHIKQLYVPISCKEQLDVFFTKN